jgi:hypothetical protein
MEKKYNVEFEATTPENICPYCGKVTDRVSGPEAPNEGDISICIQCYSICMLNADLTFRKPTEEEFGNLRSDQETWHDIEMLRFALRKTKHISEKFPKHGEV